MPGLDDAQARADSMPSSGGFDTYPVLQLKDGDIAYCRFIGDGGSTDKFTDSGYFHQISLISKKTNQPYQRMVFCARSKDEPDSPPSSCEYHEGVHGAEAAKVRLQLGLWLWVTGVVRKNQNKDALKDASKAYPTMKMANGLEVFYEKIEGPVVYKRGPGKGSEFMTALKLIRDLQGGLNKSDFNIQRRGAGMEDTTYSHSPVAGTTDKQYTDQQKAVIAELPSIMELFSGAETWPRTMNNGGGMNEMIDPATLTSLAPTVTATIVPPTGEAQEELPFDLVGATTEETPKGSVF